MKCCHVYRGWMFVCLLLLISAQSCSCFVPRDPNNFIQRSSVSSAIIGTTSSTLSAKDCFGTQHGRGLSSLWLSNSFPENGNNLKKLLKKKKSKNAASKRRMKNAKTKDQHQPPFSKDPSAIEVWRLYGISVHPDDLLPEETKTNEKFPQALVQALLKTLRCENEEELPSNIQVVRRSLDARKKLDHPKFSYVVDIELKASQARKLGLRVKSGKVEYLESGLPTENKPKEESAATTTTAQEEEEATEDSNQKKRVVVVGAGPAGLFCALQLALAGNVTPILLDRGQPVEQRGRDIGALIHRRALNPESNFAFGEGGAGTWSDGKLTTRIGRNSQAVRYILETFVKYGAPSQILWEGSPHLGTDNLVRLLRNMRKDLIERLGGEIHFGTKMTDLIINKDDGVVTGVEVEDTDGNHRTILGDATVLATGHSARDVYESLHQAGVQLEPKGFAVGFRIEHPQKLINQIQYGEEWGPCVQTGKRPTDAANLDHFGTTEPTHTGKLPVPSYRLATDKANDGTTVSDNGDSDHGQGQSRLRGVYSFCMCPGGQIVPSSTDPNEVCVNGMSFSRRDSIWANSALVVTVFPDDESILAPYREQHGILAGLEFQRDMERRASELGGGNWTVPVQRVTDFCEGRVSETIPSSSYRLGVKSAPCHEIYPAPITTALRDALTNHFSKQMPGYFHPDGLLHAVETRTSSPLRVSRDAETCLAIGTENLFPAGEGAGFAGGIVSAAADGMTVAEAVLDKLYGTSRPGRVESKSKSVGFSY